jgi:hypothetical protein
MTSPRARGEDVCAVVAGDAPRVEAALAAQEERPGAIVRAARLADAARGGALPAGAAWLWLLDGTAIPEPGALSALLARANDLGALPAPALLSSKVVCPQGRLAAAHVAWYRRGQTELAMLAAAGRLLPIRAASAGSLLVRSDRASAPAGPLDPLSGQGAALAWTAALLRDAAGYLVPASVAVAPDDGPGVAGTRNGEPADDLEIGTVMLLSGAFAARERLWLTAQIGGDAWAASREGRLSARAAALATGRGLGALVRWRRRGAGRRAVP